MADDSAQTTTAAAEAEAGEAPAASDAIVAVPGGARVADPSLQQEPPHEELRSADPGASTATPVNHSDVFVLVSVAGNRQSGGSAVVAVHESSAADRPESDAVDGERHANGHSEGDVIVVAGQPPANEREVVSLLSSQPEATAETVAESTDVVMTAADTAVNAETAAAETADHATAAAETADHATAVAIAVANAAAAEQDKVQRSLEDELQCVLCHDRLFKPVTTTCGHSFCRVCLLDSCLSRAIAETQCPICRADVMNHFSEITPIVFNVNVTLWNIIQMIIQADQRKDHQQEEDEYVLKLDQLVAKWKVHTLRSSADRFHSSGIINVDFDDDDEDDEDYVEGEDDDDEFHDGDDWDGDWGEDEEGDGGDVIISTGAESDLSLAARWRRRRRRQRARRRQRDQYPELKVENTVDGRLRVARNVILDTDDANEDGLEHMRVGIALIDFPGIFELYNEHQECSLAILKMEEDEEMDTGFPFFMSEGGDDDALIITDFYNEVTLKVFDDAGNNVMERTRAARQGVVDFPQLRLDVPAGLYTFHFSDNLYGAYLTVKTELRELNEASDAPLQEDNHYSYVLDEAAENDRNRGRQRHRHRTASDEEDAELEDEDEDSDDSFIVNDDDAQGGREATGAFSDEDDDDDGWEVYSDDEEAAEAAAQRQYARREQQLRQRAADLDRRDVELDRIDQLYQGDVGHSEDDGDEESEHVHDMTGSDSSENGSSNRAIELVSQDTDVHDHEVVDDIDDDEDEEHDSSSHHQQQNARRRMQSNRVVLDSEDDDDEGGESGRTEGEDVTKSNEANNADVRENTADADEGASHDAQRGGGDEETKEADEASNSGSPASELSSREGIKDGTTELEDTERHKAQFSDGNEEEGSDDDEVLRRPSSKRRAGNMILSDDDEDEDGERVSQPTKKLKVAPTRSYINSDDELEIAEEEDDEAKFNRIHPFYDEERDERHEAEDAFDEDNDEQEEDELETGYREYGDEPEDETLSEDDDGDPFQDEYGDDDGGGWE